MNDRNHEIEAQDLVEELTTQLCRWRHHTVRRGVRRITEIFLARLSTGDVEIESRLDAAAIVAGIGAAERGWIPCDVLAVSKAVRTGEWMSVDEFGGPLCSVCRRQQDVCRADVWRIQ